MDDVLGGLGCKLRVSGMVADSIMMGIVNSAMEQAFDKACSKEGILERLNEKSRFCELAVMQLEFCLKFVQEETDKFVLIESSYEREKLVSDLIETRDRIQRRLEETEFAIWEKDRELSDRFDSELKLRRALEIKDSELWSLRCNTNFEVDKSKSDARVGGDDRRDGDFCELKNSVDQQFFNIKQKLEDERINFTSGMRKMDCEPDSQLVGEGNHNGESGENRFQDNDCEVAPYSLRRVLSTGFEKMGSDIDILKETLDVAFGTMSNAMALAEVGPMEHQWRWAIEKDTVAAVYKGYLREIQEDCKPNVRGGRKCGPQMLFGENWSQLMEEIACLRNELDQLVSQNEDRPRTATSLDSVTSPPVMNVGDSAHVSREISFSREKSYTDEPDVPFTLDRSGKSENSSVKGDEEDHPDDPLNENPAGQGSLVAEMIRNHESIIRQKSEELNWLKGEILREKGNSAVRRGDKCNDTMKKRIQDLISRLDSVINGHRALNTNSNDCIGCHGNEPIRGDLIHEVTQLKEDQEDSNFITVIINDIYVTFLKKLVKDFQSDLHDDNEMRTIKEDVCKVFLRELLTELKHKMASYNNERHIREEMYYFICSEALKDGYGGFRLEECMAGRNEDNMEDSPSSNQFQNLESLIKEEVQTIVLREMIQEWRNLVEKFNIENFIRDEVFPIFFRNAAKDTNYTHSFTPTQYQTDKVQDKLLEPLSYNDPQVEELECIIQNNVFIAFFREMVKEWKKDIENYNIEHSIRNQETSPKALHSNIMHHMLEPKQKDYLKQTLESLSNCFEVEQNLILSASSELIEWNAHIESSNLEHEKLQDLKVRPQGMMITKDKVLGPVIKNLEIAMQRIITSKAQLRELRHCLGLEVADLNGGCDQTNSVEADVEASDETNYLMEKEKEVQKNPFTCAFSTFTTFSNSILDFQCMVHEKVGLNVSRLEEVKRQLDYCVEHVSLTREKEVVYRKAFVSRCCNLQKAEAEVDLLGDEVEDLLILLEKIYIALDHYSPVLQHYLGIKDILKLIRKELERPAAQTTLKKVIGMDTCA